MRQAKEYTVTHSKLHFNPDLLECLVLEAGAGRAFLGTKCRCKKSSKIIIIVDYALKKLSNIVCCLFQDTIHIIS